MDINILFPVLDERLRLERGIETAVKYMRENLKVPFYLTILDNGSTDETPQIAAMLCRKFEEVSYVRLEQRGVGIAFRMGVKENKASIVGYMDIDLSTDLRHLSEAVSIFEKHPEIAYINGSRFHKDSDTRGRKWYRKITSKGLLILLRNELGMKSTDAVCGFTFIRKETAKQLVDVSGNENGWFYTIELLLRAERMGVGIYEIPVRWQEDYDTTVKLSKTIKNYLIQMKRLKKTLRLEEERQGKSC